MSTIFSVYVLVYYDFNVNVCTRLTAVSELQASGIPCAAVLDSAVGFILDKVDMIFVGAEGVVENGGIINQVRRRIIALKTVDMLSHQFLFTFY